MMNPNDLLDELAVLGLTDGVETTVRRSSVRVRAGSLSAEAPTLAEALARLVELVRALPKGERPSWGEATTRTVVVDGTEVPAGEAE